MIAFFKRKRSFLHVFHSQKLKNFTLTREQMSPDKYEHRNTGSLLDEYGNKAGFPPPRKSRGVQDV